ncbi:hypothetical protein E2F43_09350 [Seongchinamella unica]|uniref:Uncharacterized protein n=1 Tax=Seongchinamella unica TaxID=2547392 RepID=A0A4R5LSB3_9GAMM|nr:hypothetical protein [Seongchinamella unica]TDG13716.1 hypothetical protein E2F43_09350 [Seongchinamella unica]
MRDNDTQPPKQSRWLKLMLEGQLTRDSVLKTRTEIDEDKRRAEDLEAVRRTLSGGEKDSGVR